MQLRRFHLLLLAAAAAFVAGCRSSSLQFVPHPDPSVEITSEDVARVYVIRRNAAFGRRWLVEVHHDATLIGKLAAGDYLCFEREPGPQVGRLVTVTGALELDHGPLERFIDGRVEAGQVYFVAFDLDYESRKANVEMLDADEGHLLLAASALAPVSTP